MDEHNFSPSINEGDTVQNESHIAEYLEQIIPDNALCISFKYNLSSEWVKEDLDPEKFLDCRQYLLDNKATIIASSCGFHLNGKKQKPHAHYHFITTGYVKPQSPSDHRKRWNAKKGNDIWDIRGVSSSIEPIDLTAPKYQVLAYPLKEGIFPTDKYTQTLNGKEMPKNIFNVLLQLGTSIYETNLGLRLRQEKSEERQQVALNEIFDLVKDKNFSNFREMVVWLEDNYIKPLPYNKKPKLSNYKANCQAVGSYLGIWNYCDNF